MHSFFRPLKKPLPKWIPIVFVGLSAAGFFDSLYLTISHYQGASVGCSLVHGCSEVLQSEYAVIFGIPLAVLGMAYYLFVFLLSVLYFDTQKDKVLRAAMGAVSIGFVASLWFVYLQAAVIKAFCLYCLGSAAITIALFLFSLYIVIHYTKKYEDTESIRED
ncbi:MAG: vitamin K epoxide reductase family protein [archaeon]|nr:vitamin K epoxide reductase family protein [archaeon]